VGEEAGLLGSRYNADFPVVPLEKVQAVLNMDMVGRDDCDNLEGGFSNSVFLVGDKQLMYQAGYSIAATDKVLERDNKGPRVGFGWVYRATPLSITMSLDVWARMMASRLPS